MFLLSYGKPGLLRRNPVNQLTPYRKFVARMCLLVLSVGLVSSVCCSRAEAQTQPAGEMKPLALISISGYDELKEDINFLGSLAGQPNLAAQFEPFIMGFTQGLNKGNPLGLIVQTDGAMFGGAICLPLDNLTQFLANLKAFGVETSDAGNGLTQVSANGQTLFAKQGTGWAFLSVMPQMMENLPADPGELFAKLDKQYDLAIQAHVQNIPEAYRQMAVQQIKAGMDAGMKPMKDESQENFQARKAMTAAQVDQLIRLINEINELTIGFSIDHQQQRAILDFVYTAVAGSQLAEQIAEMSNAKTNFAGFFQPDAAGMMMMASKMNESDIAQTEQMIAALRQQVQTSIDEKSDLPSDEAKETAKSAADDFIDALLATAKAGMMDGGAVFHLSPTSMSLVAGGFIGDPTKVESGLKKIAELGKNQPDMPEVKWNADSHHGVNFHTLSIPTPDEDEPRQLFGETIDMAVGIGKNSVFFSLGRDCIAAAKKVIDDSAANPHKSIAPMEFTVALGKIFNTIAAFDNDPTVSMIADALKNEAAGRDHVRIVAQPVDNGLRSRLEVEEGALRAVGVAVKAQQMQAVGAGAR